MVRPVINPQTGEQEFAVSLLDLWFHHSLVNGPSSPPPVAKPSVQAFDSRPEPRCLPDPPAPSRARSFNAFLPDPPPEPRQLAPVADPLADPLADIPDPHPRLLMPAQEATPAPVAPITRTQVVPPRAPAPAPILMVKRLLFTPKLLDNVATVLALLLALFSGVFIVRALILQGNTPQGTPQEEQAEPQEESSLPKSMLARYLSG